MTETTAVGYVPVNKAGDTMTGTLTLNADPVANLEAATKQYVDAISGGGAPNNATYIVQTPNGTLTNEQAMSALNTGLVKNTTGTGVQSIAVQGTDYYAPGGTDVAVADGGSGRSTATPYAVICGGTTTTNPHQSVASVGTSGQVLTSNGAGALPTFQNLPAASGVNLNTKTGNYTLVAGDQGKLIVLNSVTESTRDFTLTPGTLGANWWCYIGNISLNSDTKLNLLPSSGTINGTSGYIVLPGQAVIVQCDGTNFYIMSTAPSYNRIITNSGTIIASQPNILSDVSSNTQSQSQASLINSNVWFWPFLVPSNFTAERAYIGLQAAVNPSDVTVGIYASNSGQTSPSGSPLGAVAITTNSGSGFVNANLGTPIQLYSDTLYWCALQTSTNTTLSLYNCKVNYSTAEIVGNPGTAAVFIYQQANAYSSGTLPAFSGASGTSTSYLPLVWFNQF
jgi:hypothetical protein